jgi:general stress protein 26
MSQLSFLQNKEAIRKLQDLATEISICIFCSGSDSGENEGCRPMATAGVDEEGTIWFISDRDSEKNKDIAVDPRVKLYYSHPGKSSFLVVSGEAEIVYDREKVRELWNPLDKAWFKEGEDDPAVSLIRVRPEHAHYWDTKGNRMVNFIKMVASVATGKILVEGEEGSLRV